MIDVKSLRGSSVRGPQGERGRVLSVAMPWIRFGWNDVSQVLPREESVLYADPRMENKIEILTLDRGWIPMGRLFGVLQESVNEPMSKSTPTPVSVLVEELRDLLAEKKGGGGKHYPFKNKSKLGPGPYGGENKKTGQYKCKCGNYSCTCKGPDGNIKVNIDRGYKKAYNHAYKQWHALHGGDAKKRPAKKK